MNFVLRLAAPTLVDAYPLPVDGETNWYPGPEQGCWQTDISLPEIPENHIIVPSYMQLEGYTKHYFQFCDGDTSSTLQHVPGLTGEHEGAHTEVIGDKEAAVTTHIDCWHTSVSSKASTITVVVKTSARPQHYLLVVSLRPLLIEPEMSASGDHIAITIPAAISQMQADVAIRHRICSPTALQMSLSKFVNPPDWEETIQACFDPISKAYGSWPLAIRWAAEQGIVAAVEVFSSWQDAMQLLQRQIPLICSIRFETDQLKGAPLAQTPGHLVLLYGVDGDEVLVKDPAAADHQQVERRYAVDDFIKAWLSRRGAAYVLAAGPSFCT